jgi:Rhs element Vgr protein
MSAPSPIAAAEGVLSIEVKSDGTVIDSSLGVMSIDTWIAVNKVPKARIMFADGDMPNGTFPVSDLATFLPGKTIDISAGYGDTLDPIFSGIVIAHRIEISGQNFARLIVDLADKAIKMTVSRNTAELESVTDSDLIGQLISAAGLSNDVAATTATHEMVVQFHATDWDMMLMRAEMNGLIVIVDAGKVTVKAPDTSSAPVLTITYGESLIEISSELDALRQLPESAIKGYAWDSGTQQLLESGPGAVSVAEPGNVSSATLSQVIGVSTFPRLTGGFVDQADLQSWVTGELLRSRLAKIRGSVRFQGSALAKAGTMITLEGVGARFSGNVFVSAVHHDIRDGNWITDAEFGLASESFAERRFPNGGAAGHLPSVKGLQTGIVKKVAEDPAGGFRVQVTLPLSKSDTGVWARLTSFYASSAVGAVFYPEVGDEVVVAFMNEDPRFPIILGSVYGKKLTPPDTYTPANENDIKGIVTRSKMEVSFNEKDKIITIKTPGGHVMTLNDTSGEVNITDSNKNAVTLGKSGIVLDSASQIEIKAKGNINITATGNLAMKATGNATCEGLQVGIKAQTAFSAEGNASAELKASGMVTVQGALVKIN